MQNTLNLILMKSSLDPSRVPFVTGSLVFAGEILKTCIASLLVLMLEAEWDFNRFFTILRNQIWHIDTLKLLIPSGLYVIQNNLLFVGVNNLPAAVYQVTYQLKVLTTALFTVLMLYETDEHGNVRRRSLSQLKWGALCLLMVGVALVQLSLGKTSDSSGGNHMVGLLSVIASSLSSGFAGVYFEKMLKGSTTSLWVRNIQLGMWGMLLGYFSAFYDEKESNRIAENGFFVGWDSLVIFMLFVNAGGGLLIALVVKYADNILKGFATSVAIILSSILSIFFFNFIPSFYFLLGTLMVLISIYLYSLPDPKPTSPPLGK